MLLVPHALLSATSATSSALCEMQIQHFLPQGPDYYLDQHQTAQVHRIHVRFFETLTEK